MSSIKGVIFDYGGTIDSRGKHWSEVIWDAYQAVGIPVDKPVFRDAYVFAERELARTRHILPEHNFLDLLRIKMQIELGWLADNGHISRAIAAESAEPIAQHCYAAARECVEEARPVLEAIQAKGLPMVLVSNFYGNIESVLADFDLLKFFPRIIESAVVGVRKPDPAIFALGVEAMGLPADEILVVGDSYKKDILPALSLGCQVAWLKGKGWTADEDAVTHPSVISSLSAILSLI